jgi:hypothetical protein
VLACRSGLVATAGPFLPGRMREQPRSLSFTAVAWLAALLIAGMAAFATPSFASVTQQQKITAPSDADGATNDFGQTIAGSLDEGPGPTIAVSGDGQTALVGDPGDDSSTGAVWVFVNDGGTWVEQTKLSGPANTYGFGQAVSLSEDGSTAAIGGQSTGTKQPGEVWIYVRSGTTWSLQNLATSPTSDTGFGTSLGLSDDGSTAIVGDGVDSGGGPAWTMQRTGTSWATPVAIPSPTTGILAGNFGEQVAISGDGQTALIANPTYNGGAGTTYVYVNDAGSWSQQAALSPSDEDSGNSGFGSSVALDQDGNRALIGGPEDGLGNMGGEIGAAWVYDRTGTTWSEQHKFFPPDETGAGVVGTSVALSADGNTALFGGQYDDGQGAAWLFTCCTTPPRWDEQAKISPTDATGTYSLFGSEVALSDNASVALIAGRQQPSGDGAVWAFTGPRRASATAVKCAQGSTSSTLECNATVTDTSGQSPQVTPTGTVTFTAPVGSFASPSCTLAPVSGGAACSADYTPASGTLSGGIQITASYTGDGTFGSSHGTFSLCANGQLLGLDSVSSEAPHSDGFQIGSAAVLHGCGFKTGMQLSWGSADQTPEQITDPTAISADGTTANVTVPWEAVTGAIAVEANGSVATLADQPVDSFRNTEGLSFQNYGGFTTRQEFVDAFAATPMTTGQTFANGQPILLPRYETFYSSRDNPGGFCYGFAYFTGQTAAAGSPLVAGEDPYHLDSKGVDQSTIQSDWWKQFADETRALDAGENYQSAAQVRAALDSVSFRNPAIVSFFWTDTTTSEDGSQVITNSGHAILGFAVQNTSGSDPPGDFTIYTYNSNDPYKTAEEDTLSYNHTAALERSNIPFAADGTWSFPEFGLSGFPAKSLVIEPISKLTGPLHLLQAVGLTGVVGSDTSVVSASGPTGVVNLAARTSGGVTIVPDTDSTGTSAASNNPGAGGISEILGPEGRWQETLANRSGQVSAAWYTPSLAATIQAAHGEDAAVFDPAHDTLTVTPATGAAPSSGGTISLISGAAGQTERALSVTGPVVGSHATITVTKAHATLSTTTHGVFQIVLSTEGRSTAGQSFESGPITLSAGQKLTLTPASWSGLQNATVNAVFTGAGHHHTARLRNHLHTSSARAVAAKLHGKTLEVTLSTGRVDLQTSAIQITVAVRHSGRTILTKSVPFLLAKATGHTIRIPLAKSIPAGASARITVQTRTGGTTPTTTTTSRTIKLRG